MMSKKGYMALTTLLIIFSIIVTVSIVLATKSVSEGMNTLSAKKGYKLDYLADSCTEEALMTLNLYGNIPSTFNIPNAICNVTIENQTLEDFTFLVTTTSQGLTRKIRVIATRTESIYISKYKEIPIQ